MHRKSYSRIERKEQVLNTLLIYVQHGNAPEATAAKLARSLDITPSTHFNKILAELVADGSLEVIKKQHRANVWKSIYRLPPGSYTHPKRTILVNTGYRQMELVL